MMYATRADVVARTRHAPWRTVQKVPLRHDRKSGIRSAVKLAYRYKKKGLRLDPVHLEPISQKKHALRQEETWESQHAKWWNKPAVISGSACNVAQRRLSDEQSFTGVYKPSVEGERPNASGDYCEDPTEALEMLLNSTYEDLTIPTRAADFRAEVDWRLSLRPHMHRRHGTIRKLSRLHHIHLVEATSLDDAIFDSAGVADGCMQRNPARGCSRQNPAPQSSIPRKRRLYDEQKIEPSVQCTNREKLLNPTIRPLTQSSLGLRIIEPDEGCLIRPVAVGAMKSAAADRKSFRTSSSIRVEDIGLFPSAFQTRSPQPCRSASLDSLRIP